MAPLAWLQVAQSQVAQLTVAWLINAKVVKAVKGKTWFGDVIGDVHGQADKLIGLLTQLGYQHDGQ